MPDHNRRTAGFSPEYALLGFLDQTPAHGYDLYHKLRTHLGEVWHVRLSQIYNILTRLEEQGFIQGTTQAQEKRPAKRLYYLTAAGKQRFEAWLSSLSACSVRAVRVEFMTRLYFLYNRDPAAALAAIQAQTKALQAHIERLKERRERLEGEQIFNRMALSLRIRQLEVLVESLNEYPAQISEFAVKG